jgi:plasmid stability protein
MLDSNEVDMGNLLIRDVEDALMQRLKLKAELNGTSLQHEASRALERGAPLTGAERRAFFDKIATGRGFPKGKTSGAEMLRAIRDGTEDDEDHDRVVADEDAA